MSKTSQFAFLQADFPELFAHAQKAENAAYSDPRMACIFGRMMLELGLKWMYRNDSALHFPYKTDLVALIHEPSFRAVTGSAMVTKANLIRKRGNAAAHDARDVPFSVSASVMRELFHFSYWLVRTYGSGEKPDPALAFDSNALPQNTQVKASTLATLQEVAARFVDKEKQRENAEKEARKQQDQREKLDAELVQARAEIAALKQANSAAPDTHDYAEDQTRDDFIDLLLHEAGWTLSSERDREFEVQGMPKVDNPSGLGYVDYVLWGDDGKPLAVVEAKRTRRDPQQGQHQAKLYADCLEQMTGQRPLIYFTNGYEHFLWDDQNYPPRPVSGFMKKDELMLLIQRRGTVRALSEVDIDTDIAGGMGRHYQSKAIRRVGELFEKDKMRKALLVMATGSGKTRMSIALIDQLMRANMVKRVLFLADRKALVRQAVNAFKEHLPDSAPVNLITEKDTDGRVFLSTYPTMLNMIDTIENGVRRFGTGHFDLIVIDEAHRSVYRKYKAIFDYFDSFLLGLTATPRDEIDHDTYSLFDLETGVPTDYYDLDEAVKDGFLVPPEAISVPLLFPNAGIKYDDLSDTEKAEWDALEWTEDGDVPDSVEAAEVNKKLFNIDTVDKVLKHLMENGLKVEQGERLGKTIIFAKNHDHAVFIQKRFDANYPHLMGSFAQVIDFKTEKAGSLIEDFAEKNKVPHIAISVDMLDTGIDVPEVVNLVFFKTVRSKTKFWQMIGRGTRLCPDLFGLGEHKEKFLIFDFLNNFEYFNQSPKKREPAPTASLGERLFVRRLNVIGTIDHLIDLQADDQPTGMAEPQATYEAEGAASEPSRSQIVDTALMALRASLSDHLYSQVSGMSLDNFIVRPKRIFVEKYQDKTQWQELSTESRQELSEHLAVLPTAFVDNDLPAKQFDYLCLMAQLAVLQDDAGLVQYQERIMTIASALELLGNIPMVKAQLPFILEVQEHDYWQNITAPMLEEVRKKLRSLIKLIKAQKRKIVYTDFEDQIGDAAVVRLPQGSSSTDKTRFKMKVRHFLEQHKDHVVIQKLKRDEQLTELDLEDLERVFLEEAGGTSEDLEAIQVKGGMGLFIRSLTGMDRKAAKSALGEFTAGRNFTANQMEFIDLIIEHLTKEGTIEPPLLFESPFTDQNEQGVGGLFQTDEVKALVQILNGIKERVEV